MNAGNPCTIQKAAQPSAAAAQVHAEGPAVHGRLLLLARPSHAVNAAARVPKVIKGIRETRVTQELPVPLELKVTKEIPVCPDFPDHREKKVRKVIREMPVIRAIKVIKVIPETPLPLLSAEYQQEPQEQMYR